MSDSDRHINFQLMRDHILNLQDGEERQTGKKYWRSLDELADSPVFREFVSREYPQQAEEWNDPIERRTFIKLMGASLALAGLSGCVFQPPEKIVPYVKQPEEEVPGKAPATFLPTMWPETRAAPVPPTSSRRPRYWVFMIPTAHQRSLIGKTFERGHRL